MAGETACYILLNLYLNLRTLWLVLSYFPQTSATENTENFQTKSAGMHQQLWHSPGPRVQKSLTVCQWSPRVFSLETLRRKRCRTPTCQNMPNYIFRQLLLFWKLQLAAVCSKVQRNARRSIKTKQLNGRRTSDPFDKII